MKLYINIIVLSLILIPLLMNAQTTFSERGMTVTWSFQAEEIIFEVKTPTVGRQAIRFNESSGLSGTYLIMGRIQEGKAEVAEHYTKRPVYYQSISEFGFPQSRFKLGCY